MWKIVLTETAEQMLLGIRDKRIQQKIRERIDGLKQEPEKQGKALTGNLTGLRSLRAAGQRYRIIYSIENQQITVIVLAIGIRRESSKKDVYELAVRLLKLGLLSSKVAHKSSFKAYLMGGPKVDSFSIKRSKDKGRTITRKR